MSKYPEITDVNLSAGLQEVPKYINTVTGGVFMNLILLAIGFIVAAGFYAAKRDIIGSFAVGTTSAWMVGLLFWLGGLLNTFNFVFLTALMIGSVVFVIMSTHEQ